MKKPKPVWFIAHKVTGALRFSEYTGITFHWFSDPTKMKANPLDRFATRPTPEWLGDVWRVVKYVPAAPAKPKRKRKR